VKIYSTIQYGFIENGLTAYQFLSFVCLVHNSRTEFEGLKIDVDPSNGVERAQVFVKALLPGLDKLIVFLFSFEFALLFFCLNHEARDLFVV
jgi:hypothetical protein